MLTAADMNAVTADAQTAYVATNEATTSTTYTDLTTSGPAVTISLVNGQQADVWISAKAQHSAGGTQSAKGSFAVSGAGSQSASDADSYEVAVTNAITASRPCLFTAGATGSFTFTMKYRVITGGTGNFAERRIIVRKH